MSDNVLSRVLLIVILSIIFPIGLIIIIFEMVGIGEYVFPILFPTFGFTIVIIAFVFGFIMLALRFSTSREELAISGSYHTSPRTSARLYMIPQNCPSCGREILLSQAEWRDDYTLVCPSCFADISISKSN